MMCVDKSRVETIMIGKMSNYVLIITLIIINILPLLITKLTKPI